MNERKIPFEIDLVCLWVDGNDPEWQKRHREWAPVPAGDDTANSPGRYADNDELRYSLRSVERYAPWIRRIYIVTDRQTPRWLDTSNPKIRIVDHSEILPPEALPTFNSVVIEHALHRIPGLAEHFLYANDDMFFNREVSPSDFFTPEGLPIIRLFRRPMRLLTLWIEKKILKKNISNYTRTIVTAAKMVKRKTGRFIGDRPHHNIDPYRKSLYAHTFETFREEIEPTLCNRLRADNDIQRVIYSYLPLAEKKAKKLYVTKKESFLLHNRNHSLYALLEEQNPLFFCVNESPGATDADREKAKEYLKSRFPEKSSYEK